MIKPIIGTQKLHFVKPHSYQLKTAQISSFTLNNCVHKKFYYIHDVYETNEKIAKLDDIKHIQMSAVGKFCDC